MIPCTFLQLEPKAARELEQWAKEQSSLGAALPYPSQTPKHAHAVPTAHFPLLYCSFPFPPSPVSLSPSPLSLLLFLFSSFASLGIIQSLLYLPSLPSFLLMSTLPLVGPLSTALPLPPEVYVHAHAIFCHASTVPFLCFHMFRYTDTVVLQLPTVFSAVVCCMSL